MFFDTTSRSQDPHDCSRKRDLVRRLTTIRSAGAGKLSSKFTGEPPSVVHIMRSCPIYREKIIGGDYIGLGISMGQQRRSKT